MLDWPQLEATCRACTRCGLCETRHNVVFGVGPRNADVMFVGEGPGQQEDLQGEPFVGPAGQLLDDMLCIIDLGRHNCYIANIVKCRPPKNRDPMESGGADPAQNHCLSGTNRRLTPHSLRLPHHPGAWAMGGKAGRLDDSHLPPLRSPPGHQQTSRNLPGPQKHSTKDPGAPGKYCLSNGNIPVMSFFHKRLWECPPRVFSWGTFPGLCQNLPVHRPATGLAPGSGGRYAPAASVSMRHRSPAPHP